MRKFVAAAIIIAAFILDSCEPGAAFDKPQPDNVKSLASFPERLHGRYLAADQASIVTITDNLITRHYEYDHKRLKDSLGASYKIIGDSLLHVTEGTKEKILLNGDTITMHANWKDTLFMITDNNVLKKFKGYYFLNIRYDDSVWEVKKLSLKKGTLTIGSASDKDDIQKLKEITETTDDTTAITFSLTKRQFKEFVKQDGFGEQETFTRMTEKAR
jgi:hypothetical protein